MHYANGKEAKVGDKIVGVDVCNNPIGGVVIDLNPQSDTCNLTIVLTGVPTWTATAGKCLLVDDVTELNKNS